METNIRRTAKRAAAAGRTVRRGLVLVGIVSLVGFVAVAARSEQRQPISITLAGDVMMGRGVAPVAAGDPSGLFADVRWLLRSSDIAAANLESPLTLREHQSPSPYALEADPGLAVVLGAAGFDILSLANNHSGDAGPEGVVDTIEALHDAGVGTVGAGVSRSSALAEAVIDVEGTRVAFLAFDATGSGLHAGEGPGVASWDEDVMRATVEAADASSDLLIVSVHGGVEYLPESDPRMLSLADDLADWGADVVWGHGAHVAQPVMRREGGEGRPGVVATSLGNFLFDQRGPLTGNGIVLQLLADRGGVIAYRVGETSHTDDRVHWVGWAPPEGDAALIDGEWWTPVRSVEVSPGRPVQLDGFPWGTVVAAGEGRVTSEEMEIVVSFRHLPGPHPVRDGLINVRWVDSEGRSAHLGIYRAGDMSPVWVAGMVPAPVAGLAVCDGSVALAYSTLDDMDIVATGGAIWRPIGLHAADRLPGDGRPGCADIDGDGSTEPVILHRGHSEDDEAFRP